MLSSQRSSVLGPRAVLSAECRAVTQPWVRKGSGDKTEKSVVQFPGGHSRVSELTPHLTESMDGQPAGQPPGLLPSPVLGSGLSVAGEHGLGAWGRFSGSSLFYKAPGKGWEEFFCPSQKQSGIFTLSGILDVCHLSANICHFCG